MSHGPTGSPDAVGWASCSASPAWRSRLAIGAALFLLPVRTWFDQDRQLDGLEYELGELQTVNGDLQDEVQLLQTDDGIVGAAREELGHIQPGDNRETMQPLPPLPRDLPQGWPYSQVGQIIAIREAAAAADPGDGGADSNDSNGGWLGRPVPATAAPTSAAVVAPTTVAPSTARGVDHRGVDHRRPHDDGRPAPPRRPPRLPDDSRRVDSEYRRTRSSPRGVRR